MKSAADFRRSARGALHGKWFIAVTVGLVASLLGAVSNMGPEVKLNIDASGVDLNILFAGQSVFSTGGGLNSDIGAFLMGSAVLIMFVSLIMGIVYFILGSIIEVGYARFNLKLADREDAAFSDLFSYFSYWKTTAGARFLQGLYVLLWSLLLIIPGIMASFSYAMTDYILAEHPEMSAGEAIDRSKEMMRGNRWRLFCLEFSFIGWTILCSFTFGIGNLWLVPYKKSAESAFYREVSGTEYKSQNQEWDADGWQDYYKE